MKVAMSYLQDLTEADLYFIVKTVVDKRQDYDHIVDLLKDKPDLVEIMLEDEKLFWRVQEEEDIFLKISPFLLFTILLIQTKRDLERTSYTMEIISKKECIPVFDTRDMAALLQNKDLRAYLARILASFTKVDSTTVVYRARGLTYQRQFSELNFDDVLELAALVDFPYRYDFYKRLADISLFLTGIFPEYLSGSADDDQILSRFVGQRKRSIHDYEEEGRRYYDLAATYDEAREQGLDKVLSLLAEKFTTARKPLNYLAENFIYKYRGRWFA